MVLLDVITEALSLIQVYAPGEAIPAADSASLLFTANAMLDGWGAEPLTVYTTTELTFNLAAGQQSYTLGTGLSNNWITTWLPAEISRVGTVVNGIEIPLDAPLDATEWAAIPLKSLGSNIVVKYWPSYGAAAHTLWFWPLPIGSPPVTLYAEQQVPQFVALTDTFQLPPGYLEAFTFELCLKAAPKYGAGAIMPDWLPAAAAAAKSRIKEFNFPALDMRCDPALSAHGRRSGGGSLDFYLGR